VYSTYYGGSREEFPQALAVDGGGNAYVGGIVASSDLPTMSAFQPSHGGGAGNHYDGFVGKFSPSGSMLFSTYIGGNADDWLFGVTVNSKGLFAGGSTASTNFPGSTTSGGWITQLTPGGAFVHTSTLQDASWQALSADDTPAVHAVGTGGATLTVSPNAAQLKPAGPWSGAALYGIYSIDGSGVIGTPGYLTFFGGGSGAVPYEVAADGHGGAYFGGFGPTGYPLINRLQASSLSGGGFLTHFVPDNQFVSADAQNIVAWARDATAVTGSWKMMVDPSAAGGRAVAQPDAGLAKVATPVANPAGYAELTFNAPAGGPYHLWLRGKAQNDSYNNDSAYVQFSDSNDSSGHPIWRIGTTSATPVLLEDCTNCGVHGWGWQDNGYGANVLGPDFHLATSGPHTIRFQNREDGFLIDEVLIAGRDPHMPPDTPKDASRVLPPTVGAAPPGDSCRTGEAVLYASGAQAHGAWSAVADNTAAGGSRMVNPDRGAAKLAAPLASPVNYFEMSFTADAGIDYHLWLRGTAQNNYWGNDSVFVQFNDSVDASAQPTLRVGTTSGAAVNLEDCSGCGDYDWGWQDNGYGKGIMGPNVRFATSGLHTIRVQVREDGFSIDQIVLSAKTDIAASPGLLKDDRTILPQCANPPLR
jgi:hypothetical protein